MSLEYVPDTERPPSARLRGFIEPDAGFCGAGPCPDLGAQPLGTGDHFLPRSAVLTQDSNDCVANEMADAVLVRMVVQGTERPRLISRRWLYHRTRRLAHREMLDEGSRPDLAAQVLDGTSGDGYPDEELCPYEGSPLEEPTENPMGLEALRNARDQRGAVKLHPLATADDVERAIRSGRPVSVGGPIDQGFEELSPGGIWVGGGRTLGLHMFGVRGVFAGGDFEIKTSWSEQWADRGYGRATRDVIDALPHKWAIEFARSFSRDNPLAEVPR